MTKEPSPVLHLRAARERLGLRQAELAAELGVSQATVSHWETGRSEPSLGRLLELAEVLETSLDALVVAA